MLLGSQVEYGHKTFNKGQSDQRYSMQDLLDFHGLLHTLPWDEGLGKISEKISVILRLVCVKVNP